MISGIDYALAGAVSYSLQQRVVLAVKRGYTLVRKGVHSQVAIFAKSFVNV